MMKRTLLRFVQRAERLAHESQVQGHMLEVTAQAQKIAHEADQDKVTHRIAEGGNQELFEQQSDNIRDDEAIEAGRPSTPPNSIREPGTDAIDPDLLSLRLERMVLTVTTAHTDAEDSPLELHPESTTELRQKKKVKLVQRHTNERFMRQCGKQRKTITFTSGTKLALRAMLLIGHRWI